MGGGLYEVLVIYPNWKRNVDPLTLRDSRIITFSYFIPVMLRKIMQPEHLEAIHLQRIVKQWTALSPLRLIAELAAWILLCFALMHL